MSCAQYFALSVLVVMGAAPMATAADRQAESWAASCAACHGTGGYSVGGMPALAGRPASGVLTRLRAFRAGEGEPTLMHQIARGYSDVELARIATVFAAQPAP